MGIRAAQAKGPYVGKDGGDGSAFWIDPVISFYDIANLDLPVDPVVGDRYIAMNTGFDWTKNYIYEWNGTGWTETFAAEGMVAYVKNDDEIFRFHNTEWFSYPQHYLQPVLSFFDNSSALPTPSGINERYIALDTANGWTENNIYTWNDTNWEETVPLDGTFLFDNDTAAFYWWNGTLWKKIPNALSDLEDVMIAAPQVDQFLKWNGVKWINATIPSSGGAGVSYFLDDTATGISTYETIQRNPPGGTEVSDSATFKDTDGQVFIGEGYITAALGRSQFDGGQWSFNMYVSCDIATGSTTLTLKVYKRTSGGTETLLFSVDSDDINEATATLHTILTTQPAFSTNTTDRLLLKIYGQTTHTVNVTLTYYYKGTTHSSGFDTPFTSLHNDLPGLQGGTGGEYYHLTAAELAAVASHAFGGSNHSASTIASIQTKVSDGSLITSAANEFTFPNIGTISTADTLLIEDNSAAGVKRSVSVGDLKDQIYNKFWIDPVISVFDNSGALPVGPSSGDRYIAEVTANGWTEDYIYEWDGAAWQGLAPAIGMCAWNKTQQTIFNYAVSGDTTNRWFRLTGEYLAQSNNIAVFTDNYAHIGSGPYELNLFKLEAVTGGMRVGTGVGPPGQAKYDLGDEGVTKISIKKLATTHEFVLSMTDSVEIGDVLKFTQAGVMKLPVLTTNGFLKTSSSNGTVSVDTTAYSTNPHGITSSDHSNGTISALNTLLTDGDLITTKAAEISTITEKTTLVGNDLFLIEDSADSNNKKRVKQSNIFVEADPFFFARAVTTSHYTGFVNQTDSTLTWTDGTRKLALSGTFDVYGNGTKYSPAGAAQLEVVVPNVTGYYYIWYTFPGGVPTLNASTSTPGFNVCIVASVYWNSSTSKGSMGDERHWCGRDYKNHQYLHQSRGTAYASGLAGTFTNTTFSIGAGVIFDEDIQFSTGAQTTCDVYYHNGTADWVWDAANTNPYKLNGGQIRYNNGNALADVGNGNYVAYWMYATNKQSPTGSLVCIMGQRIDTTLANCRANALPSALSLGTLPTNEMKLCYRIIYHMQSGAAVFDEITDYRSGTASPVTGVVAADHAALSNLAYNVSGHTGFFTLASSEISTVTLKATPTTSDYLLIEDAAASNAKKSITIGSLPAATPAAHNLAGAQHNADTKANLDAKISDADLISTKAAEISALTQAQPVVDDYIMFEDASDSNNKKMTIFDDVPKATTVMGMELYLDGATPSAIDATYLQLGRNALSGADNADTVQSSEGVKLLKGLIFDTPIGRSTIPSGTWVFNLPLKVDLTGGITTALVKVYTRTLAGAETLQFTTAATTRITNTGTYVVKSISHRNATINTAANSDYLVVKVYIQTTNATPIEVTLAGSLTSGVMSVIVPLWQFTIEGQEINSLTSKGSPALTDILLAEDSAAFYSKKKFTVQNLAGASAFNHALGGSKHTSDTITNLNLLLTDGTLITTKSGEINALTEKTTPVGGDWILIEDSAASNAKKKVSVTNLLSPVAQNFPEFQWSADMLKAPWDSEYPVNGTNMATTAEDSNNGAILSRQFDDSTEEGVAFDIDIPAGATNIIFTYKSRAETAPGTSKGVKPAIYVRTVGDNVAIGAWSARQLLTTISIPATNPYFQYDTETVALATLGITAGKYTQFELTRATGNAADNLVGDWNLAMLKVTFS